MKRKTLLSLLVVGGLSVLSLNPMVAQSNKKSQLAKEGRTIEEIVPEGWEEQHVKGDLNKDGIEDIVLVVLPNDPAHIKTREDGFQFNFNPKYLAVYFGSPSCVYKCFKVWDKAIPRREDEYMESNADISITPKGVMDIRISFWASMGTAGTGGTTYRYRFQSGDFYLIGEECSWFNRMSGEGERTSINYLTGQRNVTTGNMIENTGMRTRKERFKKEPLRLLGSFTM